MHTDRSSLASNSSPLAPGPLLIGLDGDTLGRKRTGDESYLASLMRGLGRVDDRNQYVVFVRDAAAVEPTFPELARFRFRNVWPRSVWLRHPFGLPYALRRERVDLLHSQYFRPPLPGRPVVLTVHDISFAVRPEYFTRRDRILLQALVPPALRHADRIITDAEYTRRDMVRVYGLDPAKIEIIPLAADPRYHRMDPDECRRRLADRYQVRDPYILYVGTLQPRKNVHTLIRGYALFRERTKLPHKLVIVGKPKYKFGPVFDAIEAGGLADHVVFTGFVADEDLPVYYNAAEAFAFPSLYEGFGLPVLEAMACGAPVVSSNASCLPEVAGNAALLVDPDEPEAFCSALTEVLSSEDTARRMREAGLKRAAAFSWDRTARETVAIYQRVVRERRSQA